MPAQPTCNPYPFSWTEERAVRIDADRADYPLAYGYRWFNGVTLTDPETDLYNQFSREAAETRYKDTAEELRNRRHKFLLNCFYFHGKPHATKGA